MPRCGDDEALWLATFAIRVIEIRRFGTAIRVMIGVMTKHVRLPVGTRGATCSHDVSRPSVEGSSEEDDRD